MAGHAYTEQRSAFLRRTRHRVWMLIALCLLARAADAALGLHLIEPIDPPEVQQLIAAPAQKDQTR